jgi:gas vesicle protein
MANNNFSNEFIALIAGVGIGALAGVLFAPEKGSVLRKRLHARHEEGVEKLKRKSKGLKRKLKADFEEKEHKFEDRFNALVSKSSHKSEEIISALEKKLIELRELKAKANKEKVSL